MNKQLTKEECLEALKGLIYKSEVNETEWLEDKQCWLVKDAYQRKIGLLFQLINEHFDNPPLKFNELVKNMWVWDNKGKCYRELCILFEPCKEYPNGSIKAWHELSQVTKDFLEFEENRLYRKEVKDDE